MIESFLEFFEMGDLFLAGLILMQAWTVRELRQIKWRT